MYERLIILSTFLTIIINLLVVARVYFVFCQKVKTLITIINEWKLLRAAITHLVKEVPALRQELQLLKTELNNRGYINNEQQRSSNS